MGFGTPGVQHGSSYIDILDVFEFSLFVGGIRILHSFAIRTDELHESLFESICIHGYVPK